MIHTKLGGLFLVCVWICMHAQWIGCHYVFKNNFLSFSKAVVFETTRKIQNTDKRGIIPTM